MLYREEVADHLWAAENPELATKQGSNGSSKDEKRPHSWHSRLPNLQGDAFAPPESEPIAKSIDQNIDLFA